MSDAWRIELLGGLRARRGDTVVTRFRTQKTGALLAFLAFYRERPHSRESLVGMHWPEDDEDVGRHKLRQALSSLRTQMEPAGGQEEPVLIADRQNVQLNPRIVTTDVAEFETALKAADTAQDAGKIQPLMRAVDLYVGGLLPGYYEPWITAQMLYLEERYFQAVDQLVTLLERSDGLDNAIQYAGRALSIDPLREETHRSLMKLYAAARRPADVVRQYHMLERTLKKEWNESPSPETHELMRSLTESLQSERVPSAVSGPTPFTSRSNKDVQSRLPLRITRFFGRERELADLHSRITPLASRLVTLTGPGGSGKTRLAIEAAGLAEGAFAGAVWFVPLADLADSKRIADAIADALDLPRSVSTEPFDQVVEALSRRPALLLLDSLEHLLPQAAATIRRLLEQISRLSLLITSRQRLGLAGEQELPVSPLPTPTQSNGNVHPPPLHYSVTPSELMACPSVQLFADRAQLTRPDFLITRANARAVMELCDRLEGIPLAIELAAAHAQVLSPAQMLGSLARRFDFLVSHHEDVDKRHQTLRESVGWSFQLLSPDQQRFFARLSVFRGGWTAEAAEAVAGDGVVGSLGDWGTTQRPNTPTLQVLSDLRERSLIIAEDSGAERRFRMLETLREFGAEQLGPDSRLNVERRHFEYFLALAERADRAWWGPDEEIWLERLDTEIENLRTALRWAIERETVAALRLGSALVRFWYVRGYFREGLGWLQELFHHCGQEMSLHRAQALSGAGLLAREQADYEQAEPHLRESLRLYKEQGDTAGYATALQRLGIVESDQRRYEAAFAHLNEALALHRELSNRRGIAITLACLARTAMRTGDSREARHFCEAGLAEFRALENKWGIVITLYMLGVVAGDRGDYAEASQLYEASLSTAEQIGNRRIVALCRLGLGLAALRRIDLPTARAGLREAARVFREIGDRWGIVEAIEAFATLNRSDGHTVEAARLLGAAAARRHLIGAPQTPVEQRRQDELVTSLCETLGESEFCSAWEAGRIADWDRMVEAAMMEGGVME